MPEPERRKISELIARYEFEPSIEDVFVEGSYDKELINASFRHSGTEPKAIYEIDTVDVPDDLVKSYGLTNGCKQRVTVLAREISKHFPTSPHICLVDRDLDHWFGDKEATSCLRWTKFCSIEGYFIDAEIVEDLLIHTLRSKIRDFPKFFHSMTNVLKFLYILRLADMELGLTIPWIAFDRCLEKDGDEIKINSNEYIKRNLMKAKKSDLEQRFKESIKGWEAQINCDHRLCIRGHDFVEILAWTIDKFSADKKFANVEVIGRLLLLLCNRNLPIHLEVA